MSCATLEEAERRVAGMPFAHRRISPINTKRSKKSSTYWRKREKMTFESHTFVCTGFRRGTFPMKLFSRCLEWGVSPSYPDGDVEKEAKLPVLSAIVQGMNAGYCFKVSNGSGIVRRIRIVKHLMRLVPKI